MSLGTRRAKSADCQRDLAVLSLSPNEEAKLIGLSPGGRVAILLRQRMEEPAWCRRCGESLDSCTGVRCGHCGAVLCGGKCAVPCGRVGLHLVHGCTARFCCKCEPIHTCSRRFACGATCRKPQAGMGKRRNLRLVQPHRAGLTESRSNSSPLGGPAPPLALLTMMLMIGSPIVCRRLVQDRRRDLYCSFPSCGGLLL